MTGCGKHALEHLPLDLSALGMRKPLILTSKSISVSKGFSHVINAFKESDITIGIVDSIDESSGMNKVQELSSIYQDKGFDSILALGGACVVNVAKVVNIVVSNTDKNLKTLAGQNKINRPLNTFFHIPAGPGSGFETAGETWIGYTDSPDSLWFSSPFLMPDKVIIDPRLMQVDCLDTIVGEAMASLACCAEAHCTTNNPLVRAYAATGISLILENFEPVILPLFNPIESHGFLSRSILSSAIFQGSLSREKKIAGLATGAAISGYLWSNCPDLITVQLGRKLAQLCSVSPGILMGILLPTVLESLFLEEPEKEINETGSMERLLLPLAGIDLYCATPEDQRFDQALALLRQLTNSLFMRSRGTIPNTLEDAGLSFEQLDGLGCDIPEFILEHAHSGKPIKQGGGHVRT